MKDHCYKRLVKRKMSVAFIESIESASAGYLAYCFSPSQYSGDILCGSLVCYDLRVKE